jgi:cell division protein FtsW (lipid II flippase)
MTRGVELGLVAAASLLAAVGIAMVGFAHGRWLDAQVALTFVTFALTFGSLHLAFRAWSVNGSQLLLPIAAFLSAIGLVEVYRIDPDLASLQRWSFLAAAAGGVLVVWLLRSSGVAVLRRYRYLFLAAGLGLLLLPLLPDTWLLRGVTVNGSRLWVRLDVPFGGRELSFQPGEIAKVFLTVFLASFLAERADAMVAVSRRVAGIRLPEPRHLGPVLIAAALSFGVLIYQRDLGASLLLFALVVAMLYVATGRAVYVATGLVLAVAGGAAAYRMFGHVQTRVAAWLDPFADFTGAGYQTAQGLFALGSGSLTGSGLGLGRPDLIPAAATDFVFAAVAEELGLAGSIAVITAYTLLITIGFGIALRARDRFRKYLAAGMTIAVGLQTALILAGVLRLFPLTGITLPFMSYGGSSLLASVVVVVLLGRVSHEEAS